MKIKKHIAISYGTIPVCCMDDTDSILVRFHDNPALQTAQYLMKKGHDVTIVTWKHTGIPDTISPKPKIVKMIDISEYINWFISNAGLYDGFILATEMPHMIPESPYSYVETKTLDIPGIIRQVNDRCCIVGYGQANDKPGHKQDILRQSKTDIMFCHQTDSTDVDKIAIMPESTPMPCTFDEQLELIHRAVCQKHFVTEIMPLTQEEKENPSIQAAISIFQAYMSLATENKTYDTIAVPVSGRPGSFITTSDWYRPTPVLVRSINNASGIIYASGEATPIAPALQAMGRGSEKHIIVHSYGEDVSYNETETIDKYLFPGTMDESACISCHAATGCTKIILQSRGYLKKIPIWETT